MRFRQLVVLLVILAALAGAALWKKNAGERQRAAYLPEAAETALGVEISPAFVTKVSIERSPDEKVALSKDASGNWTLPSHFGAKVRKNTIDSFLGHLGSIRGELRSQDEAVLEDFGITDGKAIHIRVGGAGEAELAHLVLSAQRPRGTVNFVRLAGSPKVIATSTDLLSDLGIFSDNDKIGHAVFSDLRPAGIDSSKVRSIALAPPGGKAFSMTRKDDDSGWTLDGEPSAEVDKAKVNEFFAALYNLYANAPADPTAAGFPTEPWLRLKFKEGEKPEMLELWKGAHDDAKNSSVWKVTPDNLAYELSDNQTEPLLKKDRASFLAAKAAK